MASMKIVAEVSGKSYYKAYFKLEASPVKRALLRCYWRRNYLLISLMD